MVFNLDKEEFLNINQNMINSTKKLIERFPRSESLKLQLKSLEDHRDKVASEEKKPKPRADKEFF